MKVHAYGRLGVEAERLFGRMLGLALALVAIVGVAVPSLFALVFSEEWREAGVYIHWQSPWILFLFMTVALRPVIFVLERQRTGNRWKSRAVRTGGNEVDNPVRASRKVEELPSC